MLLLGAEQKRSAPVLAASLYAVPLQDPTSRYRTHPADANDGIWESTPTDHPLH